MRPVTVLDNVADRLDAAADRVEETRKAYELAVRGRNALIVAAADGGMRQHHIAARARVGQSHIVRICSEQDKWADAHAA